MKINSTSVIGNFEIRNDNGEPLLELTYPNWLSSSAKTSFESIDIQIKPKNIWQSQFAILKNGIDKGDIVSNWKGNVIITLKMGDQSENRYILRAIRSWKMGFKLFDEKDRKILSMKQNFNWKKISYNYEITLADNQKTNQELIELLIYSGFGANLYMTMALGG
jgi:hypothetical protein